MAWYPAYDGNSPVLSYLLQYKASASPWGERTNRSVSSALSSATVGGLLPYTEYTIQVSCLFLTSAANATLHQVVSVNSIGVGPPSNTVTATTAEEGEFPDTFLLLTIVDSCLFSSAVRAAKVGSSGGSFGDGAESILAGGETIYFGFNAFYIETLWLQLLKVAIFPTPNIAFSGVFWN